MHGDERLVDAANLHHLHQLTAEVQPCGRCSDSPLVLGEDGLEVLHVVGSGRPAVDDVARQRCLAQGKELALELIVRAVIQEPERAPTARGVVDDLGHHRPVVVEKQLVAYAYLPGRLNQHVPKAQFFVELAQQEHLNLCVGLLLGAIESGRKHLCVVEDEGVAVVKVVHYVAETEVNGIAIGIHHVVALGVFLAHLYTIALAVGHHQAALIAMVHLVDGAVGIGERAERRLKGHLRLWQLKLELCQFHIFNLLSVYCLQCPVVRATPESRRASRSLRP